MKRMFSCLTAVLVAFIAMPPMMAIAQSTTTCAALGRISLPNTTITSAAVVPAGPFSDVSVGDPYAAEATAGTAPTCSSNISSPQLPAFCRVTGGIAEPGAAEPINFEVWMPLQAWNGRFEALGNHGFAGEFEYSDMGPGRYFGILPARCGSSRKSAGPLPRLHPLEAQGRNLGPSGSCSTANEANCDSATQGQEDQLGALGSW